MVNWYLKHKEQEQDFFGHKHSRKKSPYDVFQEHKT